VRDFDGVVPAKDANYAMSPWFFQILMLTVIAATAALACLSDYRHHRIPNWLVASAAGFGLIAHAVQHGLGGLTFALAGIGLAFACMLPLWFMRMMGAGDVKFMAAVGAWVGPQLVLQSMILAALLGGAIALAMMLARGNWSAVRANFGVMALKFSSARSAFSDIGSVGSLGRSNGAMPYAIPLSLGTLCVLVCKMTGWWEGI
jgi:prepilin peptidase CpaA